MKVTRFVTSEDSVPVNRFSNLLSQDYDNEVIVDFTFLSKLKSQR